MCNIPKYQPDKLLQLQIPFQGKQRAVEEPRVFGINHWYVSHVYVVDIYAYWPKQSKIKRKIK